MNKIIAPIDNKNIMEDPLEDEVFQRLYWAPDHRVGKYRHLIGTVDTDNYDAVVDMKWMFGGHSIYIRVIATRPTEDIDEVRREVFGYYERLFKAWMCDENPCLLVETKQVVETMTVSFYFEVEN